MLCSRVEVLLSFEQFVLAISSGLPRFSEERIDRLLVLCSKVLAASIAG